MRFKKIVPILLVLSTLSFAETLQKEATKTPTNKQTVVFDCSSGDKQFIASRLWLIDITLQGYRDKKVPYNAVLTIHSGCTSIVSKEAAKKSKVTQKIEKMLTKLSKHPNLSIEACEIAVERFKIKNTEIHPFIKLVPNSITRVIELQNSGFAFIPFSK